MKYFIGRVHLRITLTLFQTYIGSILVAVNPYKPISGLYSDENLEKYSKVHYLSLWDYRLCIAFEKYIQFIEIFLLCDYVIIIMLSY